MKSRQLSTTRNLYLQFGDEFEQKVLVTGIFFRTARVNQFLGGEQSLVTGICSKYSHLEGRQETWSLEKNYQFYHKDTMFLRCGEHTMKNGMKLQNYSQVQRYIESDD